MLLRSLDHYHRIIPISTFRNRAINQEFMSSSARENARATGEASCRGIVRRMVNLPRAIVGEFSRAMNHSMDLMRIGNRRHQHIPFNYPPQHPQELIVPQDHEWAFLTVFEQQYSSMHPFFYACRLAEALKIAEADRKFLFLYLHAPDHPFTPSFCRETLCSEMVVQFLDSNFVSWGGLADSGEGLQTAMLLHPQSFPFCALIAPAPGDSIAVLQQVSENLFVFLTSKDLDTFTPAASDHQTLYQNNLSIRKHGKKGT